MKRIPLLILTVMYFFIFAAFNSFATPILWSSSTVNLGNLVIKTTNTLSIAIEEAVPEQLVSRADVYLEDIEPIISSNHPYNWTGYDSSTGDYTIFFSATGTGELEISVEAIWQYGIEPWAVPHGWFSGPDSHRTYFNLTNEVTGEVAYGGSAAMSFFDPNFDQTNIFAMNHSIFFDEGQTGRISFANDACAGGFYTEFPSQPAAVPEPYSILLLVTGLIGIVKVRKKTIGLGYT